ncbi:hypothetical protein OIE82_01010 [Streptomyces althioticus]|jgi:hypothetical protein|uniref:Nucleotide exchange factor GrpE n=1 Tax=Streptomyces althioticus TaxID=83380 RepID=A0ABZ1XX90_9ACTN|nr:hypothetical protein OG968_33985 [Streptomyces althioticus]WTB97059.1 hypothetical protein OHA53_01865 [Streptomyces althioticus]GGQ73021.1 hypothetical protein GCM10010267_39980 [Streptomyces griseorubens]
MSTPDDKDLTHPLEQETGERDVPPEEDETRDQETPEGGDGQDSGGASGERP